MTWAAFVLLHHCTASHSPSPCLLQGLSVLTRKVRSGRTMTTPAAWMTASQITACCHRDAYRKGKEVLSKFLQAVVFFLLQFFVTLFLLGNKKIYFFWVKEERGRQMLPNCHFLVKSINKHLACANSSARIQKLKALVNVSLILWFLMLKWPADVLRWGHFIFFIPSFWEILISSGAHTE